MKVPKELTVELLSEVIDEKVLKINKITNNELKYELHLPMLNGKRIEGQSFRGVNIDTLARKMREWCKENTYDVLNCTIVSGGVCLFDKEGTPIEDFSMGKKGNSEFEATLKVVKWIMENSND